MSLALRILDWLGGPRAGDPGSDARLADEGRALSRALALLAEGQLEGAAQTLRPWIDGAVDPRLPTLMGRVLSIQGEFDAAFDSLQQALRLDRTNVKALNATASVLAMQRRYAEETVYRRKLIEISGANKGAEQLRLLASLGNLSEADGNTSSEAGPLLEAIEHCEELLVEQRKAAAEAAYGFPGLRDAAQSLYTRLDPPRHQEKDVAAKWQSLQEWCTTSGQTLVRIQDFGVPGRRPHLAQIEQAVLLPGFQWLPIFDEEGVALNGLASSRIRLRREDGQSPLLMNSRTSAVFRLPRDVDTVSEPVVLLGGNGNYYHDLVEYIGALAVPETLGLCTNTRLLVPDPLAPHAQALFRLLGIGPERLLHWRPDRIARFRRIWLPTRLVAGGRWCDPLLAHWYRNRLSAWMPAKGPARKLYLSRAGTSRRRIDNEAEVVSRLELLGFECVQPETLALSQQIELFAQATHIVGSSGAALTNMLFAPPGARVVVLQNRQLHAGGGDLYFDALASSCGHRAQNLLCTPSRLALGGRSIDADLTVNCDHLVQALEAME